MDIPSMKTWPFNEAKIILKDTQLDEEFFNVGTTLTEFRTFCQAFPRTRKCLYPHERPNVVPGHHLHFTLLPKHEKAKQYTGLSKGFHITICFNIGSKNISKGVAWSACLSCLQKMNIPCWYGLLKPNWCCFESNHQELDMLHQYSLQLVWATLIIFLGNCRGWIIYFTLLLM